MNDPEVPISESPADDAGNDRPPTGSRFLEVNFEQ
jgi:hypothetical protein